MGVTTIVAVHGDFANSLHLRPHTVVFAITNPPDSTSDVAVAEWKQRVNAESKRVGEPPIDFRALIVLPPVHNSVDTLVRVHSGTATFVISDHTA